MELVGDWDFKGFGITRESLFNGSLLYGCQIERKMNLKYIEILNKRIEYIFILSVINIWN